MKLDAAALWKARRDGATLPLPNSAPTLDEAYEIAQRIVELAQTHRLGWKVGSTSEAAQQKLGTTEPGAGPLLSSHCFRSGEKISIYTAHQPYIEGEFAFLLGDAVDDVDTTSMRSVCTCVDAFVPGLEIVGSRFESGIDGTGRELITADGGANIGFVSGDAIELSEEQLLSLHEQPVIALLNNKGVATGRGSDALGHPLAVIAWLIDTCRKRSLPLNAGDMITTGTCTGLVKITPGDEVTVEFPSLGNVTATFTDVT